MDLNGDKPVRDTNWIQRRDSQGHRIPLDIETREPTNLLRKISKPVGLDVLLNKPVRNDHNIIIKLKLPHTHHKKL